MTQNAKDIIRIVVFGGLMVAATMLLPACASQKAAVNPPSGAKEATVSVREISTHESASASYIDQAIAGIDKIVGELRGAK